MAEEAVSTPALAQDAEIKDRDHPRVLGFTPAFALTDQDGMPFSSDRLVGKPWVANFMFTRCPTTCPLQTALLRRLQDRIKEQQNVTDTHVVSFSVDPGNDSPEVLKKYADQAGADGQMWKFLTGTVEEIRNTISREGFKLAVEIDDEDPDAIQHSSMFVLVDSYQRVRGLYQSESPQVINELMADLAALRAEAVHVPADVADPEWMKTRAIEQKESAQSIRAFHDFTFSDQREASGIRFMHKIVDDSGKRFKGVHYDHGSGMVVADVDGDERLDVYFVNQVGGNELWRNLGGGKFENITESAGVFVSDRICVSAAFADVDNDGDPDLFVTAVRKGNLLFENLGGGKFRNVTAGSGLGHKGHSSGAVFFDYDRDGLVDLFVANVGKYTTDETTMVTMESIRGEAETGDQYNVGFNDAFGGHLKPERNEASKLYRNLGERKFEDVTTATGLIDESWTGDATPVDINSDGWTDLYLLSMQGDDQVFFNRDGKKFERAAREFFPKTPWGSMGIKAFDFENDGDLDIYVTDMHSDMSQHIGPEKEKEKSAMQWTSSFLKTDGSSIFGNAFFLQGEGGKFEEVSELVNAENYWPWGLSVDDLNGDGFDDAFVTSSMNFPLRYGVNSLLLNEGGERFRDAEFILGVEPRVGGLAVPWFELDLLGADKETPVLETIENAGADPKTFPERIVVWGAMGSRSSAIFDLDDDGDLDIVTNEFNHYPMVLISNLSEKKPDLAYLKVKLVGTKSNRSALGAVVRIQSGELKWMKVKDGQSGHLSHSDFPLYFGLGSAKQIDQLEVTWPSGTKQVMKAPIALNQMLTIEESE
ncbi:MAG: FG-GAP-like repeat-containing protein [Verrucomicrobia bacterium]|nr:FG-GAP-like repeat-containing protein [Verrucomicrobiota bacterium]